MTTAYAYQLIDGFENGYFSSE
ncbi:hypothetical protein [Paenibacillus azoreducens]|nr:hypothetical protein [Paenibacillus azoreducens]